MTTENQFFSPFPAFELFIFVTFSWAASEQRLKDTITLPKVRSGDGLLCTLRARLTLGVVVFDVTIGLSYCKTAFRYSAFIFPSIAVHRGPLPFKKFSWKTFYPPTNRIRDPIAGKLYTQILDPYTGWIHGELSNKTFGDFECMTQTFPNQKLTLARGW